MSTYQVLARKYRPQQFSEVVGQEHIVRTLENSISQKRMAHAYLFVGPRGTGKTTLARIFAKALNCSSSKEATIKPCDECSNCKEVMAGNSMDVLELDGASNRGIDHVRELREIVRYMPSKARYKIIYIDEVHMLTPEAFNALLKTLEEPPAHVKFLFATTDAQKIPLTILSRCQRFDLHRIPNGLMVQQLRKIASLEKIEISDTTLLAIARGAVGGLRDAESALDQIIAFCGNQVEENDVLSIFGLVAHEQINQLTKGILTGERGKVITLASTLSDEGKDLGKLLSELISHFRNILILQAGVEPSEITPDELTELKEHTRTLHRGRTLRILEILTETENQMRWALSKKILFEVTLLKVMETKDEVLLEEILKKLKALEGNTSEIPSAPKESATSAVKSSMISSSLDTGSDVQKPRSSPLKENKTIVATVESRPSPTIPSTKISLDAIWQQLLEHLEKTVPMLKSSLMEGRPLSQNADTLFVGFDPEFELQKELVDTPKSREMIQNKLREITHQAMNIKVVFADDPSIPTGDEPAATQVDENQKKSNSGMDDKRFEDDPLIQKALEIFKGQIVEIRR